MDRREKVRQGLKMYHDKEQQVMLVKFRLPSGKSLLLTVSIKETVSYLFDFIYSHEVECLGF